MMLLMMYLISTLEKRNRKDLHDLAADGRFQCAIVVGQVGQLDLFGLIIIYKLNEGDLPQSMLRILLQQRS